jgi:hypothetical protein
MIEKNVFGSETVIVAEAVAPPWAASRKLPAANSDPDRTCKSADASAIDEFAKLTAPAK